jgi:molecular chaperone GrpE
MTKDKEKHMHRTDEAEIEDLSAQVEQLTREKDDLFARLQRLGADYENYQKRSAKQIADTITYEKEVIIKTLLPALDNFEHALANAEKAESIETIAKGVRIVYDQILQILKAHGVEQIAAVGEHFDPSRHEAMLQQAVEEKEDGIVLEEYQKGYTLNGRIIRPARVIVNKLPEQQPEETFEEPESTDMQ